MPEARVESASTQSTSSETHYTVHIEFGRIQTYLAGVPHLRTMVGANALLGEVVRGYWNEGAGGFEPVAGPAESLPALALEVGTAPPPEDLVLAPLGAKKHKLPETLPARQDDPWSVARTGVLTRDGGHFEALFESAEKAREFVRRAGILLARKVPGARWSSTIAPFRRERVPHAPTARRRIERTSSEAVLDLPYAHACELSGEGPASEIFTFATQNKPDHRRVGPTVARRIERGDAFDLRGTEEGTKDVLGLMRQPLLESVAAKSFPADMLEIAKSGYVAVVHADGNAAGSRSKAFVEAHLENGDAHWHGETWRARETFFHALREGMRASFAAAFEKTFEPLGLKGKRSVPARPLMVAGDDLLFVCDAALALDFVLKLEAAVREATSEILPDGKPLTLGIGVAIVQASFPFHRAHDLAAALESSAKRYVGAEAGAELTALDWILVTQAWHGEIGTARYRESRGLAGAPRALTRRPVAVALEDQIDERRPSLAKLVKDARALLALRGADDEIARSQLKALVASLDRGRSESCIQLRVLPRELRTFLAELHYVADEDGIPSPWVETPNGAFTAIPDLVEVFELERMRLRTFPQLAKKGQ